MICIYCLKEKNEDQFTHAEHVLPQSFGKFKNNFTLKNVCNHCNQYFGNNLEICLARNTIEGLSRFGFGTKKKSDFKHTKQNISIKVTEEGPFKNTIAFLEYSSEQKELIIKPYPQIGFKKINSDDYEYFLLETLAHKNEFEQQKYDFNDWRIYGCEKHNVDSVFKSKGFVLRETGTINNESVQNNILCEIKGRIDIKILRAVSKICFNYLAYWEDTDFVLRPEFNPIRNFILTGEQQEYSLAKIIDTPILSDENEPLRRLGHIIILNWAIEKNAIFAKISIYNQLTYCVSLARNFMGKHKNIRRGHFFNIYDLEILEVR